MTKKTVLLSSDYNPFSDYKLANQSDELVLSEFSANKQFWSLFNDQHEIVVGTRGCGKSTLLRMMRYSMLRRVNIPRAKDLVGKKDFVCFYIALHLEYITSIQKEGVSEDEKAKRFYFFVSCKLALSILGELKSMLEDAYPGNDPETILTRDKAEYRLTRKIDEMWGINPDRTVIQLSTLYDKVNKMFHQEKDMDKVPNVFVSSMGGVLASISKTICDELNYKSQPTWIVCIDEVEFTDESQQKCINTAVRSDTCRIVYKIATLHYYYKTHITRNNISVSPDGQDIKFRSVDLSWNDEDFTILTNNIVKSRLERIGVTQIMELEKFLCIQNLDRPEDYYELTSKKKRSNIKDEILQHVPNETRVHYILKTDQERKKPLTDKLAPVYMVREMRRLAKRGHSKVAWFVGASMVRRISQGNPRIFIQLMYQIFETASKKTTVSTPVSFEKQFDAVTSYVQDFCDQTVVLKGVGKRAANALENISTYIELKVHREKLGNAGISFQFSLSQEDFEEQMNWIKEAIAFSRLTVDNQSVLSPLTPKTSFMLVNPYAVKYWLPMQRKTSPPYRITKKVLDGKAIKTSTSSKQKRPLSDEEIHGQISMFEFQENEGKQ